MAIPTECMRCTLFLLKMDSLFSIGFKNAFHQMLSKYINLLTFLLITLLAVQTICKLCNVCVLEQILTNYLKDLESGVETTRSGHALALGALPLVFLDGILDTVLSKLVATASITPNHAAFVTSRQDALKALTR